MDSNVQHPPIAGSSEDPPSKTIDSFAPDQDEPIRVNAHEIEMLQIDDIKFIEGISDYPESHSLHPSVCRTELGFYCIDDYCKIIRAIEAGSTNIKCEVEYLSRHSDMDLKLRKTTHRIIPTPGRAPFYPTAVNVRTCFESLLTTSENLVLFGQGGDRLSQKFISDRQHDVRLILRTRCGRGPDSVNAYLSATENVDPETQEFLFKEEATKAFCDYIRKEKSSLVTQLQSRKFTDQVISAEVSSAIRGWFTQFKATGIIQPYTSALLVAPKVPSPAKGATTSGVTSKVAGPSKRLKKMVIAPAPPPMPANTGAGPAPVLDPTIAALADELNKAANELTSMAETMKGVTDAGLKGAFYFDYIATKIAIEDIFNKIAQHFEFNEITNKDVQENR